MRILDAARVDLKQRDNLAVSDSAVELTEPVLDAAHRVAGLVAERFRAVPVAQSMPWTDLRVTAAQRARALGAVVEDYDRLISRWYEFVFLPPLPTDRGEQVADLRRALSVGEELARCESHRHQCEELAETSIATRTQARQLVTDFRTAVATLEEAVYRASAN